MATPPAPTYDVFISYSHADQAWVWEWLIPRLKAAGLAVCTDRESFDIGVPSLVNMENAVAASRHTLLVLTPAYLASEWTMYEQILTQTQDHSGLRRRTLPVLRQPCDLPRRIAMLTYADLTGKLDRIDRIGSPRQYDSVNPVDSVSYFSAVYDNESAGLIESVRRGGTIRCHISRRYMTPNPPD